MKKKYWRRIIAFCVIGGIGFLVEVLIISMATSRFDLLATESRFLSFPCAVILTWWLNRRYNFHSREGLLRELKRYFASQGLAALTNLFVFISILHFFPSLSTQPQLVLGLAALAGLMINFLLTNFFVFKKTYEN